MRQTAGILILAALLALAGCSKSDADKNDLSEPRKAALVFAGALESGDIEKAKYACLAGGIEVELVEAMVTTTYDLRRLSEVATAKFGEAGAEVVARRGPIDATTYLTNAEVQITGNTARIIARGGINRIPLKLVDGKNWKVDIGAMSVGQDIAVGIRTIRAIDGAAKSVIDEIESGKLTTAEDTRVALDEAIASRLGRSRTPSKGSTSRPATQQSTTPGVG